MSLLNVQVQPVVADSGQTFSAVSDIATVKSNPTGIKDYDWTGNAVPVLDSGNATRAPSVTVVYCHNNQDMMLRRSTDFGM